MSLVINDITIESRGDRFINATQLCKAGGKKFNDWYKTDNTQYLIKALENELSLKTNNTSFKNLVDTKKGRYNSGSWIHPDLAVPLAQWISPAFAIQVSRWIRELFITGTVSVDSRKTDEELKELQEKVERLELEAKEKDGQLNRLNIVHSELLRYKKRVSKDETIYIVSSANYARQGIFKVGRTKNKMSFRNKCHNVTHIGGDKFKVIKTFSVGDSVAIERNIHSKLKGLLLEGEREFFMCPYDLLENLVELIIYNDDGENEIVNKIIDTVDKLKQSAFRAENWSQGIPPDTFKEMLLITDGNEDLASLDVSRWDEARKQTFVAKCIKEYIKENNTLNEEQFQIMWKTFQVFMADRLPMVKFKPTDWKPFVKDEVKKEKLTVKWRK
jgi:hypothetical protein